eukprot:c13309_g1_i1.p1 GENE.c13309_g1_i1~~c13309_g1_i1.p1  ORF type:complete len:285 (-),score=36.26 c13309_g1_i1:232-1065(-)
MSRGVAEHELGIHDDDDDDDLDSDDNNSNNSHPSKSDEDVSWIPWFCSLKGNEFFVEVDEEYIRDAFNLTGLSSQVPYYDYALDIILNDEPPADDMMTEDQQEMINSAAEMLYGLIHARYIITSRGMAAMKDKFCAREYGKCPRALCQGFPVLPVGQSDIPCSNTVKIYCSKCNDIYYPKSSRHGSIDGAYFGTSAPHLFLQTYPELRGSELTQLYVPRIFGFKVHNISGTHRSVSDGRDVARENAAKLAKETVVQKPKPGDGWDSKDESDSAKPGK